MSKSSPTSSTSISSYQNQRPEVVVPRPMSASHPLQNAWTLWYFRNDPARAWEENQNPIITVRTIEDFWAVINHVELASKLHSGCDYSLFKEGVKPMWEDDLNRRGGRWLITVDKWQRNLDLDNFWLEVMLCLIGEAFGDHGYLVNGAVVSVRNRGNKIGIWLSDASRGDSVLEVGKVIRERLGIDPGLTLLFEAHEDTMRMRGSAAKSRYIV